MTAVRIDHVIIGARRIDPVRELLRDRYGFGVIQGSAHPDGTQGWLVPFDTPQVQYLELLTAADPAALRASAFGRAFLDRTADGPAFLGWAVLSEDIEADAARVRGLTGADPGLLRGESVRADGRRFGWAEAAFEAAWRCPSRPFFLAYADWTSRTGRVAEDLRRAGHECTPVGYAGVTVRSGQTELPAWWGGAPLPVSVESGEPERVQAARVRTVSGDVDVVVP